MFVVLIRSLMVLAYAAGAACLPVAAAAACLPPAAACLLWEAIIQFDF
jgi:hypothetical protein